MGDWADDLAVIICREVEKYDPIDAQPLVAARLREVKQEGERDMALEAVRMMYNPDKVIG